MGGLGNFVLTDVKKFEKSNYSQCEEGPLRTKPNIYLKISIPTYHLNEFKNSQVSQDCDVAGALVPPQRSLNLLYNFILEK